ncbi:M20/M25/M40 family metallo-hydrolase [Bacillus timonensis]|uniref:M20/M25/M40 family metallo-hydrolase n=1 Tax=Bacillus timonensis TaxID=1033734 RepID=UPI001E3814D5|nr:M20/M25/M40 family metallo-hydrolase [Bacillus timonensis]
MLPSTETKRQPSHYTIKTVLTFILIVAIIVSVILLSLLQLQTPKVVPSTAETTSFSADRAFSYLEEFAVKPHPLGSKEHDHVRDYLVKALSDLGLSPQIQKTNSLYTRSSFISGGTVENIYTKIEGTNSTKAIMLVAHYDSVPGSPGVSDDGAGVAAILETVSALKKGQPLQNDVIILLTDGEENGLLGAKAFVDEHPWVDDIGLVLNFEARGNEGPAFMFETSDENGWLVKEFVQAAPSPVAHSFIYNLYKLMPNDTDLTVFRDAGLSGLNFAFGEGISHYHTTSDNLQELSKGSLQHHGEYMLNLIRHFGELDLTQTEEENQLFFNIFGSKMITYSEKLIIPLMLVIVALYAFTIVHASRYNRLSLLGTLAGFLVTIGGIVGSFAIGLGLWSLLKVILSGKDWLMGTDKTFGTTYLISFSIIIFTFLTVLYYKANKKIMTGSLTMGALLMWLILVISSSLLLKAGSYVFAWPLFFALLGVNISIRLKEYTWKSYLVTVAFAIPAFLILPPVIYLVQMLVTMNLSSVLMVLVALLGILLIPILSTLKIKYSWVMPTILLGAGLLLLITNSIIINNMPTAEHPKASDITYFMDADTNSAYWAARHSLDAYTANYLDEDVKVDNTSEIFPILNWDISYTEADLYNLEAPSVTIISDNVEGDKRIIEYQMKTYRNAEEMLMKSLSSMNVSQLLINDNKVELIQQEYTKEHPLLFSYIIGQSGELKVKITVEANDKVEWILADRSYNIPETKGERSPEYSTYGDNSFVMKTIRE